LAKLIGLLDWSDRKLGQCAGLFAIVGSIGLAALLGITVVAVASRYAFNAPIFGIEDLSVISLTLVAAGAVSFGARRGAHVSINLIDKVAGKRVTRWTDTGIHLLAAATCFVAAVALITKSCGIEKACITSNLSIEHRPFVWVLSAAFAFYALHLGLRGLSLLVGRDLNEEND